MYELSANFDTSDLLEFDGHYYLVVDSAKTHAEASAYSGTLSLEGYSGYLAVISSDAESQFIHDHILAPNQYRPPDSSGSGPADFFYFGLTRVDGGWVFEHPDGLQPVSEALTDPWATTNFTSDPDRTVGVITGDSYIPGAWEDSYRSRGEWIAFGTAGEFYSVVEFEPTSPDQPGPAVKTTELNEQGTYFYTTLIDDGGVLATWEDSPVHDGEIVYQRFGIDGSPIGDKVVVADDWDAHVPGITQLSGGGIVATYQNYSGGYREAVYKIFDPDDNLVFDGIASQNNADDHIDVRAVALESGGFVVSYDVVDDFPGMPAHSKGLRFFDPDGSPATDEILIGQPLGHGARADILVVDPETVAFLWVTDGDNTLGVQYHNIGALMTDPASAQVSAQTVHTFSDQVGNIELTPSSDGFFVTYGDSGSWYLAEYRADGSVLQAPQVILVTTTDPSYLQVAELYPGGDLMVFYSWQPDGSNYETFAKIVSADGLGEIEPPIMVASGRLQTNATILVSEGSVFFSTYDGANSKTHSIKLNDRPEFDQASYLATVDENIATGSLVLDVDASDPESDPLVYSLTGPDAGDFVVDPDTGVISLSFSPDYESKSSYDLVVEVSDGFSLTKSPVSIEVIDGNDEPVGSVAIVGPPVVGEYVTLDMSGLTDADGGIAQVLSYHWYRDGGPLEGGRASTGNPDKKELPVLEEDTGSSLSVEVTYTDGRGFTNTVMSSSTGSVFDLNDPPEFVAPSLTLGIDENISTSTVIFDADATDPDGDSLTYSLQGDDAGSFAIDGNSGEVRFKQSPDYETHASYDFTVTASDGELSGSVDVTVNVNNVNEAPLLVTDALGDQLQRPEIELAQWSSDDGGNDHYYGIKFFDSELYGPDAFREFMATQSVQSDFGGHSGYVATITSPEEQAFIDGALGATLAGIWGPQAMIGATDLDDEGAWRWFSGPEAGTLLDEGFTNWSGDQPDNDWMWYKPDGEFLIILDYKTEGGTFGGWNDGAIQSDVRVTHPYIVEYEFASVSATVDENVYTSTIVFDATATDPDGDSLTYSLQGTDAGSFTIDVDSGQVRFDESPDYETHASYDFTVIASDDELSDSVDVTVNINDINDSPNFATDVVSMSVDENVSTATVVYDADATDADGDDLTYSVSGVDADKVTIDPSSGEVRFSQSPDYESHSSYDFTVTASDGELSGSVDVTVNVNDVNEAPDLGDFTDSNVTHSIDTVRSIRVATDTTGALIAPAVDSWPDGHSVVAWSAFQHDNISQVYAQILGPDGQKVGDQILVCADNEGQNGTDLNYLTSVKPSVAVLANGQFVVGWNHGQRQGLNVGEADTETVFRIFNQDGTPVTPIDAPIIGYDPIYNNGHDLDILALSDGGFMIALGIHSRSGDGLSPSNSWEVVAQRFDDDGATVGGRIHVNTSTWGNQSHPSLTELSDGTVMAVWKGSHQSLGWEIFGQRIDGAGNKHGSEFRVVTSNAGDQRMPASVMLDDGNILVAWEDHQRNGDFFAQRIDQDGAKVGSEFKINQASSTSYGNHIDLVPTPDGFFAVYSTLEGTDILGGTYTTYGRHFQADGTSASDEIEISTYTHAELPDSRQNIEAVETGGRILVVSETNGQEEADWSDSVITASFIEKDTVSVSIGSVDENMSTSTVIFDADATDVDGDELTYGVSGADADKVTIDPSTGEVRFNESPDYESGATPYEFTVTASDGSLADTIDVTLDVTDVNEAPAFVSSSASASVAEDAAVSTVVYAADASDEDGDTLTFSLGGTDGSLLTIDSTTGEVTLNASPNYENKDHYLFTVTASDGSLTDAIDVTLAVTDVNEAPQLGQLSTLEVAENSPESLVVHRFEASDPDSDDLFFSLSGSDADYLQIDPETGDLRLLESADFETKDFYEFTVTASEGALSDSIDVTLEVTDEPEIIPLTDRVVVSMSGATYPVDTWELTLVEQVNPGELQTHLITLGDFSITGSNIQNAANAFVEEINAQLPDGFSALNLTADSLSGPQEIEITGLGRFMASVHVESATGASGSVNHGPVVTSDPMSMVALESESAILEIVGTRNDFAALHEDGSVSTWGNTLDPLRPYQNAQRLDFDGPNDDLTVVDIEATVAAFAALRSDGSVVTWGHPGYGGSLSPYRFDGPDEILFNGLTDVDQILSTRVAFTAVKSDGSIVTWGELANDSDAITLSDVGLDEPNQGVTPVKVVANDYKNFAALMSDGTVRGWGRAENDTTQVDFDGPDDELSVIDLYPTKWGFHAVRSDGTVVQWDWFGNSSVIDGLDLNGPNDDLTYQYSPNWSKGWWGFGLLSDGSLAIPSDFGEVDVDGPNDDLEILEIDHISWGTTLLRSDGQVIYLGNNGPFPDLDGKNGDLTVETVVSNTEAFAALLSDGSVVTFGGNGGLSQHIDFNGTRNDLAVESIFGDGYNFAATLSDGSVVSWGYGDFVGSLAVDPAGVDFNGPNDDLSVEQIYTGRTDVQEWPGTFSAVLSDGSVVSWGNLYEEDDPLVIYEDRLFEYQVTVTDPDQQGGHLISIQSDTPWLAVHQDEMVVRGTPDHPDVGQHTVEILVTDSDGLSATQVFDVLVEDVNQAPRFESDHVHVSTPEHSGPDHIIYVSQALDPDGDELTYWLNGEDADHLSVDSQTGDVRLNESAVFVLKDRYEFDLTVSDGQLQDTVAVTASVVPFFDQSVFAAELVSASKQSIEIDLKLYPSHAPTQDLYLESFQFDVAPVDGWDVFADLDDQEFFFDWGVDYSQRPDLTQSLLYNASSDSPDLGAIGGYGVILGQDEGYPGLPLADGFTIGRLTLGSAEEGSYQIDFTDPFFGLSGIGEVSSSDISLVVEVKNNSPVLVDDVFNTIVEENAPDGQLVYHADAIDIDEDELHYFLTGLDAGYFDIDSVSGEVFLSQSADFEQKRTYEFFVGVTDGDLSDLTDITIEVLDNNDSARGAVLLSDATEVGDALYLDWSGLTDQDDGVAEILNYRWYRDGLPLNEDGVTFDRAESTDPLDRAIVLLNEDIGSVLSAEVTYRDGRGYTNTVMSEYSGVVEKGTYSPIGSGVYFDGTLSATGTTHFGSEAEGAILFTIRPDHQTETRSVTLIEGGGLDVYLDFDGEGGYQVRAQAESGEYLLSETLATEQETTVAVRYLAVEGELEVITPNQHTSMTGLSWNTPLGEGVVGHEYQGFLSQVASFDVRDPEIDLLVLNPGSISDEDSYLSELYRFNDLPSGTDSVNDSETAKNSYTLELSRPTKSGGYSRPEFSTQDALVSVAENEIPIGPIYQVSASDADNDSIVFALADVDEYGRFMIDPLTGELWMLEPADFEEQEQFTVAVEASDGVLTSTLDVVVEIVDVDEYRASGAVSYWKDPSDGIDGHISVFNQHDGADDDIESGFFLVDDLLPGTYSVEFNAEPVEGRKYTALDALLAMKMAVGLIDEPDPYALIAADINQNGRVTSSDALDILKLAVMDPTAPGEQFVFLDRQVDVSGVSKAGVSYSDDINMLVEADTYDVDVVAVLLGDVDGSYSHLI